MAPTAGAGGGQAATPCQLRAMAVPGRILAVAP